jgi:hypothetical protein
MANIKELIQSIEAADSSFDEKLAAITEMEKTLVSMRAQEEQAVQDNVDLIVEAIKVMERKVESQLEVAKSIVPEKGDKGDKGDRGLDGANGFNGKDGRDGINGRDGKDGQDGVSVTDAKIDFDGSLVITLSTGQEINVGEVVAHDLAEKIKVISTMSTSSAISILDEGTNITSSVKSLNFVGSGVTATTSGNDVTVTVSSGGGSGTVTSVATGTGLTGGPITSTGTISIDSTVATLSGAQTLTNKRIDPRVASTATATSLTPDISANDVYAYTALASGLTINAPIGTPVNGDKLIFRILDNGTTRTITWNATFTSIVGTAFTNSFATTANKTTYIGCIYNAFNTRWDVIAVTTQA